MRNYQTLTVIGAVLTILIGLSIWLIFSSLNIFHGAFNNFTTNYGTQQQIQKYNEGRQMFSSGLGYLAAAIPIGVFLNVFAMIAVFVFKDRFKMLGILLIVIAILTVIAFSAFGIVSFGMLIAAGIVALRYKRKGTKNETTQPSTNSDKSPI
jgi:urocanate hydratase